MKKLMFILLNLIILNVAASAQTRAAKNNISVGAGIQQYNGDLGNSFFDFEEEWYGVVRLEYGRYLNRSLDAQAFATSGDIGRCFDGVPQPGEDVLNLRSRFTTMGVGLKYKFANGFILREASKIAPYIYAGAALTNHRDLWVDRGPRVNEGYYTSINGGVGVCYHWTPNFQITYNLGLGYFTSDALDFISEGANDMYLQNTLVVGFNF